MNSLPPIEGGRLWQWPTDGSLEALPEYFREVPKDKLFEQAQREDAPFGRRRDDDQGRYALLAG